MRNVFFWILLLISLTCFTWAGFLLWQRYAPITASAAPGEVWTSAPASSPQTFIIHELNLTLPIYPAKIRNNRWDYTSKGVSYLTTSVLPGQQGNSVIYGHNWPNIFKNLQDAKEGQLVTIIYADGHSEVFSITDISIVKPSQIDIIQATQDTRLTIFTCTGFLDSLRLVIVAKPF
ncbi:MAG TPA: sortase [Patescibacteria group bacterium]|uniref:Sortase n=1 Tax=Candidatus Amesbacteria bacterium RIFCSPLOWO2_01_FULL_48_25 TaxID=1797259 RepID=A0A1F4ZCQ5_9BACT|nr:MAG: hypothetical protein A2989_01475 [Candidatus Amesbacteria bacterium RIFCSPLOWO2_01_FULL_48_25]HJZ05685.1 sortase [Patescibacteria group bacterium]